MDHVTRGTAGRLSPSALRLGQAEVFECPDQFAESIGVQAVGAVWALDENARIEKRASVDGYDRALDTERADGIDLAAGIRGVVVDQVDPKFAAKRLRSGGHAHGSGERDRQTLGHPCIVPSPVTATEVPLSGNNANPKLTKAK